MFLQSKVLQAGKITVKIKMQKYVKISGREFVLNVDSSYESGIYIQIIFLTVMFFFYFAICVLICHLQIMALSILITTWVFIIYFSRMQTIFFSLEFFNVVLSSWSQFLSWWICEKNAMSQNLFFVFWDNFDQRL